MPCDGVCCYREVTKSLFINEVICSLLRRSHRILDVLADMVTMATYCQRVGME